jgi:hypothetical protein
MTFNGVVARLGMASLLAGAAIAVATAGEPQADPRADIAKKIPGTKVEELKPTAIPGMYELTRGTDIGYVTSDGRFYFGGDLYDIQQGVNLTDASRNGARRNLLATIPESETITFSPANPKYTITVFTDVDCGYCRKLHSEIKDINRLGVRVRYVFYPREGPGSESHLAETVGARPIARMRSRAPSAARISQSRSAGRRRSPGSTSSVRSSISAARRASLPRAVTTSPVTCRPQSSSSRSRNIRSTRMASGVRAKFDPISASARAV